MSTRLFYTNKIKTVAKTLVADQQAAQFPSSNLQTDNYSQTWRTTEVLTAHDVVNDFGIATLCDTVFLGNVNLTSSATVKIQGNATDSWGAPTFDETITVSGLGVDPPHRNLYHEFASGQTFRFFRIEITDTGNTNGHYEVGEWWLGERVALGTAQQHESEHRQIFQRENLENITEFLQKYVYTRAERRVFELLWDKVTPTTRDDLRKLARAVIGSGLPFVYVQDPDASPKEGFFVRIGGDLVVDRGTTDIYGVSLNLEEEAAGQSLPVVA